MILSVGQIRGHIPSTPSIHARLPPVKDILVLVGIALGFATLVTVHVALAGRLFLRTRPRWRDRGKKDAKEELLRRAQSPMSL